MIRRLQLSTYSTGKTAHVFHLFEHARSRTCNLKEPRRRGPAVSVICKLSRTPTVRMRAWTGNLSSGRARPQYVPPYRHFGIRAHRGLFAAYTELSTKSNTKVCSIDRVKHGWGCLSPRGLNVILCCPSSSHRCSCRDSEFLSWCFSRA